MPKLQTTHIALVNIAGRRLVRAPDGFCFKPYPTYVEMEGRIWEYYYCEHAIPHYREVTS